MHGNEDARLNGRWYGARFEFAAGGPAWRIAFQTGEPRPLVIST
jgi:hypothetical protein